MKKLIWLSVLISLSITFFSNTWASGGVPLKSGVVLPKQTIKILLEGDLPIAKIIAVTCKIYVPKTNKETFIGAYASQPHDLVVNGHQVWDAYWRKALRTGDNNFVFKVMQFTPQSSIEVRNSDEKNEIQIYDCEAFV